VVAYGGGGGGGGGVGGVQHARLFAATEQHHVVFGVACLQASEDARHPDRMPCVLVKIVRRYSKDCMVNSSQLAFVPKFPMSGSGSVRCAHHQLLWYKKPPTGNHAYHRFHHGLSLWVGKYRD
jgi:hypothetical protein